MGRLKRAVLWAVLGAIPGIALLLLTLPISGEIELTVGVFGIVLTVVGAAVGASMGAARR